MLRKLLWCPARWPGEVSLYGCQCVSTRVLSVRLRHLWVLILVCWRRVVFNMRCPRCRSVVTPCLPTESMCLPQWCVQFCPCISWPVVSLCCVCRWPWVCPCLWKLCRPWWVWWVPCRFALHVSAYGSAMGIFVPAFRLSHASYILMMTGCVLCTRSFSSSTLFLMPSMLTWSMTMPLSFGWLLFGSGWVMFCWWVVAVLHVPGISWLHRIEVYLFVTKVKSPNDWSECGCVLSVHDPTRRPPLLWGAEPARRQGGWLAQIRNRAPISGGQGLCRHNLCKCL